MSDRMGFCLSLRHRLRRGLPVVLAGLMAGAVHASAQAGADDFVSGSAGSGDPINNMQPSLGINYFMPLTGVYPSRNRGTAGVDYLGQIRMFAGNFTPSGAVAPEGQLLAVNQNDALFSLVGTFYGGDGETTFAVPDLSGTASVHHGQGPGLSNWNVGQMRGSATTTLTINNMPAHSHGFANPNSPTGSTGGGQAFSNFQPTLASTFWIATEGIFPSRNRGSGQFLGQVTQFAGNFAARGWAEANGQILPIAQNQALFAILGTTYGGDGETTFALPDLRGRVAVHPGQANGTGTNWQLGQRSGSEGVTLGINNLPAHDHSLPELGFDSESTGGNQPFDNTQPGLGLNYIIATSGVFPSQTRGTFGEPLLGEITMFAGNFAPRGWALLDGQLLSIEQNQALFSILGTTYGGDGETTFALPDMRGRTAVHADGTIVDLGESLGLEFVALSEANLPEHDHTYIPEPGSLAVLAIGGLLVTRRRRRG